jgi:hypothetical protein
LPTILDFTGTGHTDFLINSGYESTPSYARNSLWAAALPSEPQNKIMTAQGKRVREVLRALKPGATIGPKQFHSASHSGPLVMEQAENGNQYTTGQWIVTKRYLGLTFQVKGKTPLCLGAVECEGNQELPSVRRGAHRLCLRDHPQQVHHRRQVKRTRCHHMGTRQPRSLGRREKVTVCQQTHTKLWSRNWRKISISPIDFQRRRKVA